MPAKTKRSRVLRAPGTRARRKNASKVKMVKRPKRWMKAKAVRVVGGRVEVKR
jgi:hypothetical protein